MKTWGGLLIILAGLLLSAYIVDNKEDVFLFKIERSKDSNQIFYTVNTDELGNLATKPITIYWIKNTKKGRIEPLTWIQKKYAYGLKYLSSGNDYAVFQFVSYNKKNFTLKRVNDEFKVFTKCKDSWAEVNKIYVQIDGGTFWFPNVSTVKIYANDMVSGKEIVEEINP